MGSPVQGYHKFCTLSKKKGFIAQKQPNLSFMVIFGQLFSFLVHYGAMPNQKTMGTRCLVCSLICEYQNICSLSNTLRCWPQNGQIWPKICFLVILAQILAFLIHRVPDQKVPRWFSDMWVPELLLPPKIIRMFCPNGHFDPKT